VGVRVYDDRCPQCRGIWTHDLGEEMCLSCWLKTPEGKIWVDDRHVERELEDQHERHQHELADFDRRLGRQ
jgi:Zn-finger nucleic acid-binding protein